MFISIPALTNTVIIAAIKTILRTISETPSPFIGMMPFINFLKPFSLPLFFSFSLTSRSYSRSEPRSRSLRLTANVESVGISKSSSACSVGYSGSVTFGISSPLRSSGGINLYKLSFLGSAGLSESGSIIGSGSGSITDSDTGSGSFSSVTAPLSCRDSAPVSSSPLSRYLRAISSISLRCAVGSSSSTDV